MSLGQYLMLPSPLLPQTRDGRGTRGVDEDILVSRLSHLSRLGITFRVQNKEDTCNHQLFHHPPGPIPDTHRQAGVPRLIYPKRQEGILSFICATSQSSRECW